MEGNSRAKDRPPDSQSRSVPHTATHPVLANTICPSRPLSVPQETSRGYALLMQKVGCTQCQTSMDILSKSRSKGNQSFAYIVFSAVQVAVTKALQRLDRMSHAKHFITELVGLQDSREGHNTR